jgi:hypothetical protein
LGSVARIPGLKRETRGTLRVLPTMLRQAGAGGNDKDVSMIYLERKPSPGLAGCVEMLWYACAPDVVHQRELVLPGGKILSRSRRSI